MWYQHHQLPPFNQFDGICTFYPCRNIGFQVRFLDSFGLDALNIDIKVGHA